MSCTHDCGCSAETRDARTDDWGHTSPLSPQNADLREFQPAEPSQPLGDVPASERPREAVLPRPITPEDVRVGMVVDIIDRARIRRVDDQRAWISDDEYTMLRRDGRSLWLVEDTPAPVDPDAEVVEALRVAHRRSPEYSTDTVFAEATLDHLRAQGFDVTPRAEQ